MCILYLLDHQFSFFSSHMNITRRCKQNSEWMHFNESRHTGNVSLSQKNFSGWQTETHTAQKWYIHIRDGFLPCFFRWLEDQPKNTGAHSISEGLQNAWWRVGHVKHSLLGRQMHRQGHQWVLKKLNWIGEGGHFSCIRNWETNASAKVYLFFRQVNTEFHNQSFSTDLCVIQYPVFPSSVTCTTNSLTLMCMKSKEPMLGKHILSHCFSNLVNSQV